ncbi:DUF433 domain-containing protein [Desulfovibrio sp.]|uniref:DUF433 domain-containing protein n=1 Tax=Desulfovibrio sp. TaxID=885 RepID=UPI003AB23494
MYIFNRITQNPAIMGGKACIRGMRVTVSMIFGQLASGRTAQEILADYPYLEQEDITQALQYAAWLAEEREYSLEEA